ncbi:MAG: hypothetical protein RR416_05340, partial [Clostridia bacterium]
RKIMYCKHCGTQLADDAYICVGCGRLVVKETNESQGLPLENNGTFLDNGKNGAGKVTVMMWLPHVISIILSVVVFACAMLGTAGAYYTTLISRDALAEITVTYAVGFFPASIVCAWVFSALSAIICIVGDCFAIKLPFKEQKLMFIATGIAVIALIAAGIMTYLKI